MKAPNLMKEKNELRKKGKSSHKNGKKKFLDFTNFYFKNTVEILPLPLVELFF